MTDPSAPFGASPPPDAYEGMEPARARKIWLTTFTDLTALMLTFFVLQFSMSKIDQVQWQNLADAFQQKLDTQASS